jgi:putative transposase
MFTSSEFHDWCRKLWLEASTCDLIARIRFSPPARRVQGRAGNVCGTYPSRKMGVTIQFESHTVELGAIYLMEHDDEVREYYDQPPSFKLSYQTPSGRKTAPFHTPDFFVIRRDQAGWEEWKTEEQLHKLAEKQPFRYQYRDGQWHCPPGEEYASAFGLSYRVRSSAELPRTFIDNLDFLEDYLIVTPRLSEEIITRIQACVRAAPGISLAALLAETGGVRANDVYALIATDHLFVDLHAAPLSDHFRTRLYSDLATAQAYTFLGSLPSSALRDGFSATSTATLSTNMRMLWDGRVWTLVNLGETTTTLLPEVGEPIQLASSFFLRLLESRAVLIPTRDQAVQTAPEVEARMAEASPADRHIANERFRLVQAYLEHDEEQLRSAPVTERTLRRWARSFQEAQVSYGSGYIGLLPRTARRGNRQPKAPEDSCTLLDTFIATHFETPRQSPAWEVYLAYQQECQTKQIIPLSARTFYRHIKQRVGHEQTKKRQGAKAAYSEEPWHWELTHLTPRHGNRPFAVVHLDHTELDVMLVSSVTGKPLGKPWVTFLVDAFSRRLLAVYLTFDRPSYRSCMMALRICVKRFGRFPHTLIVDGGKEFASVYFETLVARYSGLKKTRPGSKPRFGSVIERLFGTTNTEFVYNLLGNTQAAKRLRQMTKDIDPRRQAVWTLGDLYAFLCEWAYEVYDQTEHLALSMSPRDAFLQGLSHTGEREHVAIPYDEEFLMESSPTTRKGTAKVEPGRGIKIHGIYYSAPSLRQPGVEGTSVKVRYDPFDIGTAYAYVRRRWVRCVSQYHAQLSGHTEKELLLASKEIRRQHQLHTANAAVTARRLADFLTKAAAHEAIRQQRLLDLEARAVLEVMAGGSLNRAERLAPPESGLETTQAGVPPAAPVDIATVPVFEEYR